jgi:hypothetical protein
MSAHAALERAPGRAVEPLCPRCLLRGEIRRSYVGHLCQDHDVLCRHCGWPRDVRVIALDERGAHSQPEACGCPGARGVAR